jgi:PadR family transcriptional regulator PadR
MGQNKNEIVPGTLNLMVLKTLKTLGALHGYGIARRIEQISGNLLEINQGTIYPALLHLEQMGWIRSDWGVSENNRRARFYAITAAGRKQLAKEEDEWRRAAQIVTQFLEPSEG